MYTWPIQGPPCRLPARRRRSRRSLRNVSPLRILPLAGYHCGLRRRPLRHASGWYAISCCRRSRLPAVHAGRKVCRLVAAWVFPDVHQAGLKARGCQSYSGRQARCWPRASAANVGAQWRSAPSWVPQIATSARLGMASLFSLGFAAISALSPSARISRGHRRWGPSRLRPGDGNDEIIKEG